MKRSHFFVGLLFFSAITVAADDPLDHCSKVLEQGIRNTYSVQSLNLYKGYVREILNYSNEQLEKYVASSDGSISVPIPIAETILKAEAKSASTRDLLKTLRIKYQKDLTISLSQTDFESITSDVVDKNILDAWNQCIHDISTKAGDISYSISGKDDEIFSITFRYSPNKESDPVELEVSDLVVTGGGVKHIPTRIKEGSLLRRYTGYTQLFRRNETNKAIEIQLNIKGRNGIKISVPGLKPQDIISVGTIVSSVLSWPQYAQAVNDQSAYNPNTNKWAPCDARSIAGSELARLGGGTHTPDLRGVFLRGLNSFSSDEPDPVAESQRDTDTKRKVASFQPDQVGAHSHNYSKSWRAGTTSADKGGDRNGLWHDGGSDVDSTTHANPSGEVRVKNVAVFYYIKIN